MIADVIRNASTEHEIYFLLTTYVEAVRSCDQVHGMPEHITRLPLAGIDDVRSRFRKLVSELDTASKRLDHKACETIRDALHVFAAALHRLSSLNAERYRPLRAIGREHSFDHLAGVHDARAD